MLIRRCLLAASGGFTVIHVTGLLFNAPILPYAEVLAWGALVGYAVLAGRTAPARVRLALLGGLSALGAIALVGYLQPAEADQGPTRFLSTADRNASAWFSYSPLADASVPGPFESMGLRPWQFLLMVAGYAALSVAVLAAPARRSPRAARIGALVGAGLLLVHVGLMAWSKFEGRTEWKGSVLGLLLALVLAGAAFVAAGAALGRGGQLLSGLGLAFTTLATVEPLDETLLTWDVRYPDPGDVSEVYLASAVRVAGTGPGLGDIGDPAQAGTVLALLVGVTMIVVGCLWKVGRGDPPQDATAG
ncbi:hypothetical protein [Micromonospora polyrhachis]|uniref:Uncharacterized protein n=1 Tax=Micromonospora polyrhachis TaxID=1282883 RepID=A0A7W7SN33_9ACTN|nr:hypothetical protein [Micromonospora polyrhachis]MBB4957832.1 hypothetical protein [Micromonospora polyrhachis]